MAAALTRQFLDISPLWADLGEDGSPVGSRAMRIPQKIKAVKGILEPFQAM